VVTTERFAKVNGIELCYERFGDPADPVVLVITGHSSQGVFGMDPLVERLLAAHRGVVRFDNRDTGKSSAIDYDANPYTLLDMATDAVGLLDALDIQAAHLFGGSMGGMIAQEAAIAFPERVLTLISFMSTPAVSEPDRLGHWTGGLPPALPRLMEFYEWAEANPPTTPAEIEDFAVKLFRVLAGTKYPFDEETTRERLRIQATRSALDGGPNQGQAIVNSRDRTELLASVTAPTLVIHGTEDPIIPYEHGVATAKAVPGAVLMPIEGLGHEMPAGVMPTIVDAIVSHSAGSSGPHG